MQQNHAMKAFSRIFTISLLLGVLLLLNIPLKSALGVTVLGNYSLSTLGFTFTHDIQLRKAVLFEVPTGNDYQLNSFLARLSAEGLITHQVNLYQTDGTTRGAFVASLGTQDVNTGSTSTYTNSVFTPSSPVTLVAGQRYWIELQTVANGPTAGWTGGPDTPSGIFNFINYQVSFDGGATWGSTAVENVFTLDADEIIPPTATNTPTDTATPTITNTPTDTPIPPTSTFTPTPTDTPVPPTSTFTPTPTDTPVAPTNTFTPTPTDTPVAPTSTFTPTPTDTPVPPTSTFTPTPTDTPVPPTSTFTPTPTDTPVLPTNTPTETVITPTATPTLPFCVYGLPPGGVQGRVLIDVLAFYNPSLEATTNILVQGGSSWWIIDARNGFYKLWISCEGQPIWVLANTIAPNFDHVWQGAELPSAGE